MRHACIMPEAAALAALFDGSAAPQKLQARAVHRAFDSDEAGQQ
jgi:hypothetical protein